MGKYICYEGSEGVGKTTQVGKMVAYLRSQGFKVLESKEPGTNHSPLTMELRKLMLDSKYDNNGSLLKKDFVSIIQNPQFQSHITETADYCFEKSLEIIDLTGSMDAVAREYICQAIRNIHLQKVINPSLNEVDYIIQDRGILSGISYGVAGGLSRDFMDNLNNLSVQESGRGEKFTECYDQIILLQADVAGGLKRALSAKKEFETGDVMENRGVSFLEKVNQNFQNFANEFPSVAKIPVDNLSIEEVFEKIKSKLR